ncbi:hypothetical protein, partial [Escherichia coli]|uniref:hypothetical protein n=1 Tax=Escherichia coli TaxID=562 RepID=UPI0032E392EF
MLEVLNAAQRLAMEEATGEEWPSQEWLESAPPCHVPPLELLGDAEPEDSNLIDPGDVPLDDPAWDEFWNSYYTTPFVLPPDPDRNWASTDLALAHRA